MVLLIRSCGLLSIVRTKNPSWSIFFISHIYIPYEKRYWFFNSMNTFQNWLTILLSKLVHFSKEKHHLYFHLTPNSLSLSSHYLITDRWEKPISTNEQQDLSQSMKKHIFKTKRERERFGFFVFYLPEASFGELPIAAAIVASKIQSFRSFGW